LKEELSQTLIDLEKIYERTENKINELEKLEKNNKLSFQVTNNYQNHKFEFDVLLENDSDNVLLITKRFDDYDTGRYLMNLNTFIMTRKAAKTLSTYLFQCSHIEPDKL
jgi:hypothetical protein